MHPHEVTQGGQTMSKTVMSYIDNVDTLNKILEFTLHENTRESLYEKVLHEVKKGFDTLIKDANDNLDKHERKQLGDELLRRQHERYCQRIANT